MTLRLLCVLSLLGGCDLYWNNPPDKPCYEAPPARIGLRDPATGQCENLGGGCGACDQPCQGGDIVPNWASCSGPCEQITSPEQCMQTASCHAAFDGDKFFGCWELEPDQFSTQMCAGLTPDECSARDDCVSLFVPNDSNTAASFARCVAEPGGACDSSNDCVNGETCDWSACPPTGPGGDSACLGTCTATPPPACSTLTTETDCLTRSDCEPIYNGMDCTCDPNGCTCQVETFAYCRPRQ